MRLLQSVVYKFLRRSERYTGTDMVYLAKGGGWLGLSQVVGTISGFLLIVAFSNLLARESFGIYRFVLSFIGIINVFSFPGITGAVSQAVARKYDGFVRKGLSQRLIWEATTFFIGSVIAAYYYFSGNTILASSFFVMSVLFPVMDAFYIYRAVYHGKGNFRAISITEVISRLTALVVMTGVLLLTQNVVLIVFMYFAHQTILRTLFMWNMFRTTPLNTREDPETPGFARHLSIVNVLTSIAGQIDKILIFHFLGAAPLAVYVLAMTPIDQIRAIFGNVKTLAFPKFANQSDVDIKEHLIKKIRTFELYIVPIVLLYIFVAPYIFMTFFPAYLDAIVYSQALSLTLLVMPRSLISVVFSARMKTKEIYILRIAGSILRIIVVLTLTWLYGLWGMVAGVLFTECMLFLLYYYLFRKM